MAMRLAAASWEGDGVDKSEVHGDGGGVDMGVWKISAGDWLRGVTAGVEVASGARAASGAGLTLRKAVPQRTVRKWMRMRGGGGGGVLGMIRWFGTMRRGVGLVLVWRRRTGRLAWASKSR